MLVKEKRSIYFAIKLTLSEGNLLRFVRARAHVRAQMTRIACAVGMRNAILRNHLNN